MSIRTNPMKAVPLLLKRLVTVERQANLNDLKAELIKIKDLFSMVKKNEDELLDTLTVVDDYVRNKNIYKLKEEEEHICQRIRFSTQKLLPAAAIQTSYIEAARSSRTTFQDVSPQLDDLEMIKVNYNKLHPVPKRCFLSLLHFPENAVIKKRNIISWWIMVGPGMAINDMDDFVRVTIKERSESSNCTARELTEEEMGELVFDFLLKSKLIVPHGSHNCPIVSKIKINPLVRHSSFWPLLQNEEKQFCGYYLQKLTLPCHNDIAYEFLVLDQRKIKLSDGFGFKSNHWRGVFNFGASYLDFGSGWMAKMKHLEVLKLGRWLHDSPNHHIEVASEEFLKELRDQKHLKYLSLRGISRISELPPSILQLESLETLDLKACHNLETLPNAIASLRKLRHLDLSQCYLLDRMPEGIEKLTELQVLKGFVIGDSSNTPCRISDLASLKKLERLSIHIGSGAVIQDGEFGSLKEFSVLKHLKISWGVSNSKYRYILINFPDSLEKLHLEGFPGLVFPYWLIANKLPGRLNELSITGGKLEEIYYEKCYNLRIIRLKYLKHLNVDPTHLQNMFPALCYLEIKHVLNHSYFVWNINEERSKGREALD